MTEPSETGVWQDDRRGAVFSDDREYRYRLWRTWDESKPPCAFIMLNPSTADETADDQTIRRCIGYAEDWGFGTLIVGNLFALRAKDPQELYEHPEPVGPRNDEHLVEIIDESNAQTVVAWGAHGDLGGRASEVAEMVRSPLYALDTTKEGQPVHPLYQPATLTPEEWSP